MRSIIYNKNNTSTQNAFSHLSRATAMYKNNEDEENLDKCSL